MQVMYNNKHFANKIIKRDKRYLNIRFTLAAEWEGITFYHPKIVLLVWSPILSIISFLINRLISP